MYHVLLFIDIVFLNQCLFLSDNNIKRLCVDQSYDGPSL